MQNFLNLKLSRACDSLVSQRKFNELLKNLNLIDTLIEQRNKFEMNKTSQRKKIDLYISRSLNLAQKVVSAWVWKTDRSTDPWQSSADQAYENDLILVICFCSAIRLSLYHLSKKCAEFESFSHRIVSITKLFIVRVFRMIKDAANELHLICLISYDVS